MASLDETIDMYQEVFGNQKTRDEIRALVLKNIQLPSAAPTGRSKTNDEILDSLRNLQAQYKEALREELSNGSLMSNQRKRTLELALDAPTMDLSLISSRQARSSLDEAFQEIAFMRI